MKQTRRLLWFVLSTVLLCALLGGMYGQSVEATASGGDDSDVKASLDAFTKLYGLVEQNYAEPLDPDASIYGLEKTPYGLATTGLGAIPGMLRTLDPHSTFFDPHAYARLREDQAGKYFGVGMQIRGQPGKMGKMVTIVMWPMPGSPAFRAGLHPGDVIVGVDGKSTEGLTTDDIASELKGPRGTVVRVAVTREGSEKPLEFTITRDEISRKSVDNAFYIRPGIAYIHLIGFNETTNDELTETLKQLDEKNIKALIFDLRDNPGGLLKEAVEVSDHFLEKGQLIVYHFGRRSEKQTYYARHGDDDHEYPIIVLINRSSASAAEIVAGALQDHDRALVIGEPSFGKGLVQSVYQLGDHTGLALTTAHYYTPSGRLIQRDYEDASLYDYYYHYDEAAPRHTEVRLTDGGREVYGGGGITPDVDIPEPKLTKVEEMLLAHGAFYNFGKYYLGVHKTVPQDFTVSPEVLQEFERYLETEHVKVSSRDIQDNLDFINNHIRVQLIGVIYGSNEGDKIAKESDYLLQKALEHLGEARELMASAKKVVASKSLR
ncbi:MAG: S41 family peptidase [Terriglobia bacterium]|jgi:carboxyl-terminal processing protease